MPWVKLDDGFFDNLTNRQLGPAGRDLFVCGLTFCAKGLTDGIIPKAEVPLLLAQAQAKPSTVKKLLEAGRWVDEGDHYEIDGYLEYQPSRAQVLSEREAARERKRRQRKVGARSSARGDDTGRYRSHGVTDAGTHGGSHPLPDPTRPPTHLHPVVSPGTPSIDEPREGQRPPITLDPPPPPRMTDEQRRIERQGIAAAKAAARHTPPDVA